MDIEKIKQILKKYISLITFWEKHTHSKTYHNWEIILASFLALNLLSLGFSFYLFLEVNEGGIFLVEQDQEIRIDTVDREVLHELIESFEIKDVLFQDRISSPPKLSDPSI